MQIIHWEIFQKFHAWLHFHANDSIFDTKNGQNLVYVVKVCPQSMFTQSLTAAVRILKTTGENFWEEESNQLQI